MRDLNFFYGFIEEKRKRTRKTTIVLVTILFILGTTISSVLYLERDIYREKVKIDNQYKMLKSTKVIKLESNFENISEEERRLKESLKQLQNINEYVSGLNKITTQEILRIFHALPKNVSISSLECNRGQISIECESLDRKGVASTINNLKKVGIKEVYVPSIVAVDNEGVITYGFHISGKIQEEKNHEDE